MVYRAKPLVALMIGIASLMFTGLGMIIISMIIGAELTALTAFYYLSFGIMGLGVLLVLIGLFIVLGVLKQIRNRISEGMNTFEESTVASTAGTRVIRQQMPKPILDEQIPKPTIKPKPTSAIPSKPKSSSSPPKSKTSDSNSDASPSLSLDEALQVIITNYNLDKVKKSFNGWNETLVMRFPDVEKNYLYIISGSEGIEFKEGDDPDAAVQVEMDSILFQKLIAKQVNAIKAYSSGKMNVSGQMKNMLKLRKLMF